MPDVAGPLASKTGTGDRLQPSAEHDNALGKRQRPSELELRCSNVDVGYTNVVDAPISFGWGLAALVAGMLAVMVIPLLGLTSGSRRGARP